MFTTIYPCFTSTYRNIIAIAFYKLSNKLLYEIFSYKISYWSNYEVSREYLNENFMYKLLELKAEERGYYKLCSYIAINSIKVT